MKKKESLYALAVGLLTIFAIACSKEVPMEVRIDSGQLDIEGKTAHVIHADTTSIVLVRDSIAEENNGLYTVRTSLTLVLDSIYPTDQMEDTLRLQFMASDGQILATFLPTDSLITDSLIVFLNEGIVKLITIDFGGKMDGNSILKLQDGARASFTGFSFLFANPKVTKMLDQYEKYLKAIREVCQEAGLYRKSAENSINAGFGGFIYLMVIGQAIQKTETLDKQIFAMKEQMTPLQTVRYDIYHKELLSYNLRR